MPMWDEPRRVNGPVRLHWLGWESDTYRLSQAGWEVSAREDYDSRILELMIRHQHARCYGYAHINNLDRHFMMRNFPNFEARAHEMKIGTRIIIQTPLSPMFYPVDTRPMYEPSIKERYEVEDLCVFRRLPDVEDVVIAPPSLDDILKMALDHQAPKQKELREKARRELRNSTPRALIRVAA